MWTAAPVQDKADMLDPLELVIELVSRLRALGDRQEEADN